ncbi:carbonic anhydrase precursor [Lysobacter enzymogenes]|uniref:Carbonic anhydrase n=1 Tax=Lysobacter enzymogenes TaxID=69 RepID=A0A0S2DG19_LYSEN|nr:carbonic anhydrase family protein [Lysobacter enzymogenes]ALN57325.1 carbonic anhydrase precursor [Lysobacter enzymogenes]QCW25955.1 carbonic anhydrase family protein [Lysobacter enzymogenes]UZW58931.1 carbonic anhydrase family protein [Lysobacter enzymogenes]
MRSSEFAVPAVAVLSFALAAAFAARAEPPAKPAAAGHHEVYDYDRQEAWQALHDKSQSPVDIVAAGALAADPAEPGAIEFSHTHGAVDKVEDNGHAVQVDTHATEAIIRGRHFKLAQFHFHAQSEHTLDGKHFPLEGHFVFKAQDGRLAVVGVMYEQGKANPVAQEVLDDLRPGKAKPAQHEIDIEGLIPKSHGYYHYLGSLTTPPLTENVEWYVMPAPVTMSKQQIDGFLSHYRRNNRNIQPLNGRPLIRYEG